MEVILRVTTIEDDDDDDDDDKDNNDDDESENRKFGRLRNRLRITHVCVDTA